MAPTLNVTVTRLGWLVLTMLIAVPATAHGVQVGDRAPSGEFRPPTPSDRHRQVSTRNNLVHAPGYMTAPLGSLGSVEQRGTGTTPVILIAGLGVASAVFESFIERNSEENRFYAVTLPGYGGSSAPPMPAEGTSFGERTWLAGAQRGVEALIEREGLDRPLLVSFYTDATNVALHLSADRPDLVGGLLVLTSSPRFPLQGATTNRAAGLDAFAVQWFKTVTEIMWSSGMFTPDFYSNTADIAEKAWWDVLEPTLPTSIRYLVESWADDLVGIAAGIEAPFVVLSPGFDADFMATDNGALVKARIHDGWEEAKSAGGSLDHRIIPDARYLIWEDQPTVVDSALEELTERR